ncbi:MAG: hypothetical protein HY300_06850 [Verrucomicrobia bacterium]|nr:hypothetical protein [Verrucomicrobiota bacterium]
MTSVKQLARHGCLALALAGLARVDRTDGAAVTNAPPKTVTAPKSATAETTVTNAPPKKVEIPKSSFHYEIGVSKDPFFPLSARLRPQVPVAPVEVSPTVPVTPQPTAVNPATPRPPQPGETPAVTAQFSVKAIILGKKRSAVIHTGTHSYDFFAGDTLTVRVPGGVARVHCVEVRDHSIVIEVEGEKETRELKLRPDL